MLILKPQRILRERERREGGRVRKREGVRERAMERGGGRGTEITLVFYLSLSLPPEQVPMSSTHMPRRLARSVGLQNMKLPLLQSAKGGKNT